jgi:hypothetical protein
MTLDTILDIPDAFFEMFGCHVGDGVLVASITCVSCVVIAGMTGTASDVVITVQ